MQWNRDQSARAAHWLIALGIINLLSCNAIGFVLIWLSAHVKARLNAHRIAAIILLSIAVVGGSVFGLMLVMSTHTASKIHATVWGNTVNTEDHRFIMAVPVALYTLIHAYPLACLLAPGTKRSIRAQSEHPDAPLCHECQYNLTGIAAGTCHECGANINNDAASNTDPIRQTRE